MGVAYGDLRQKKSKSFTKKFPSEFKNINKNSKRKITIENSSKIINNFKEDNKKLDDKQQLKTVKNLETEKKTDKTKDKTNKINIKKNNTIKCLSEENLTKIEGGSLLEKNNHEELPNSLDTNFSSAHSNGEFMNKILLDEMYNEMDEQNSINEEEEEDDDEEEEKIDEDDKNNENNKVNKLMITNNIKTVFVDSKIQGKEQNNNSLNIYVPEEVTTNIGSRTSSATFDYELNFYKNGNEIRQSYISKLISKKVWNPSIKPKQHNSIIIFDWDDTLLPTSFLTPGGVFNENLILSEKEKERLLTIEQSVYLLLTEAVEKGNVYIITNAGKGWVEYSSNRFYPSIKEILKRIEIISAREYEKLYPGNSRQWKIQAFLTLLKYVNIKLVTNIICIGDSLFEMEAGRILASKFTEAFIKTIKFREAPKLDELIKQLKLVCHQFGTIYSSIKNLTIRVEKKKKEGNEN